MRSKKYNLWIAGRLIILTKNNSHYDHGKKEYNNADQRDG
jgi:hypothetical protein